MASTSVDPAGAKPMRDVILTHNAIFHDTPNINVPDPDGRHRRIFIGPMPERVIALTEAEVKKQKGNEGMLTLSQLEDEEPDKSDDVLRIVKEHAKRIFEHQGGLEDDWDEEREQGLTHELLEKWKESEWGRTWSLRHKGKADSRLGSSATSNWVGGSFEIGCFMGINLLDGHLETLQNRRTHSNATSASAKSPTNAQGNKDCEVDQDVNFLANPDLSSTSSGYHEHANSTPTSSTRLLPHPQRCSSGDSNLASKSLPGIPVRSSSPSNLIEDHESAKGKGKNRQVHYADDSENDSPAPNPPQEVLKRTENSVKPACNGSATLPETELSPDMRWGDVVLRDRMLVRVSYSKSESLNSKFDDSINRTTRDLHYEDWSEFMVAWRKDVIEVYEDHSIPGKELITGHKHLAYVIPLKAPRTNLSLYSFVDLTFCITCPPTTTRQNPSQSRWIFNTSKEGTNIFIFKPKARSRAYDWIWQLWRHLGGSIPPSLDIHNPRMNTKVTVDIPFDADADSDRLFALFTRENVIALCMKSLRSVPDWFALVERELSQYGRRLELCWRRDASVDWIWLDYDVLGCERPWVVLCGLALKQSSRPPILEIRLATHAPSHFHLRDGTEIDEPPSIEGYVERIKPNTQIKQSLYLSTHAGLLFIANIRDASPPTPPGLALTMTNLGTSVQNLRRAEVQRGANQILHATAVCDLRSIVAVRRAFQNIPSSTHDQKDIPSKEDNSWFEVWSQPEARTLEDDEDVGGEGHLAHVHDKAVFRMRRSFEILLNTGHVIRFETHSRQVAIEWSERLRALIGFWKHKHRIDAKDEIELAQARRPRLTPQIRVFQEEEFPPEPPSDMSAAYPALDTLYNWCALEGCGPIAKGGKVYMRKGLRGQYKLVHLFLVAGHLVRFRIKPGSSLHSVTRKKINLLDAYVYSGYFAALNLPTGQFKPNLPAAPRRYQDGLETDDRDEDMLFIIWYRPQPVAIDAEKDPTFAPVGATSVPALSAKRKLMVFRTRSRLERDAWCWALNSEIEKIVRVQREREEKLRDTGNLIKLSKHSSTTS